jgi:amino acid transporter
MEEVSISSARHSEFGFWLTSPRSAVIQALGQEGVLPFSRFWASNRPFDAPAAGLFQHYLICVIVMLAPPPGDAYAFLLK